MAISGKAIELVSASFVTDIFYVLRRAFKDREVALQKLKDIRTVIGILPVTGAEIDRAIDRHWRDFEDAVQYSVAESNGVDYIISRDAGEFEENAIPCCSPREFLEKTASGEIMPDQTRN